MSDDVTAAAAVAAFIQEHLPKIDRNAVLVVSATDLSAADRAVIEDAAKPHPVQVLVVDDHIGRAWEMQARGNAITRLPAGTISAVIAGALQGGKTAMLDRLMAAREHEDTLRKLTLTASAPLADKIMEWPVYQCGPCGSPVHKNGQICQKCQRSRNRRR